MHVILCSYCGKKVWAEDNVLATYQAKGCPEHGENSVEPEEDKDERATSE